MMRAILVAKIDFAEGAEYVATERYVTHPTDTPANLYCDAVLLDVTYARAVSCVLWNNGAPFAQPLSELLIDNRDGSCDSWRNLTIKGRTIEIYRALIDTDTPGQPYMQAEFVDFDLVATGIGDEVISGEQVKITLADKFLRLFEHGLGVRYSTAGNTALVGTTMPTAVGQVEYAPMLLEDPTNNEWDAHFEAYEAMLGVARGAVALTLTTDYTTTTTGVDLVGSAQGFMQAYMQGAKRGGGGSYFEDLANFVEWICLDTDRGLLDAADIDGTSLAAIAADAYSYCWALELNNREAIKCGELLRTLLDSIAASCWQDRLGVLKFGRLDDPAIGSPVLELVEADIEEITVEPDKGAGLSWALIYNKNYAVAADGDISSGASAAQRAASQRKHSVVTWNGTGHTPHAYYTPAQSADAARSLLRIEKEAQQEIERRGDLYASRRWFYKLRCRVPEGALEAFQLEPFDVVNVAHSRHGLSGGAPLRVVSARSSFASRELELLLWG